VKRSRATTAEPRHIKPRALFICGSLNQTTQLHAVARALPEVEASFAPYYGDAPVETMRRLGLIEMTIGGNKRRGWCVDYLARNCLAIDIDGRRGGYDLVVTCSDLVVPKNVRRARVVGVQEGILDPEGLAFRLAARLRFLPRWLAGTAMTGMSGLFARYCVASEGYREHFVRNGADPRAIAVTGIPNFDDCERYRDNDVSFRGYVLVCTSDTRETFKRDDRRAFIRRAVAIANGRPLVFKLHPNEGFTRSATEIQSIAPDARIYQNWSAEQLIANCDVLVTQWSSTAFVGLALGKEVHSRFPLSELRRLMPIQNGGRSARNIARVCREVLGIERARARVGQNVLGGST
jgi:hypothetical protein